MSDAGLIRLLNFVSSGLLFWEISPVYFGPVHFSPVYFGPVHFSPVHFGPVHFGPVHFSPVISDT